MNTLNELRLALVEAKATLRVARDAHDVTKAIAETAAIERLNGRYGSNKEDRERNLTVALLDDNAYNAALHTLRACESDVDRIEAQIESLLDDRRAYEWAVRSGLVDALGNQGKDDGAAFDGTMDEAATRRAVAATGICTCDECRTVRTILQPPQPADVADEGIPYAQSDEARALNARAGRYNDPIFPAGSNVGEYYPSDTREWYGR